MSITPPANINLPSNIMNITLERFNVSRFEFPIDQTASSKQLIRSLNKKIESIGEYVLYTNQNLDDFFFIICGIFVLFMQVGFACLEAGNIRAKNVTNIMLKNFLDSLISCIIFWLIGWALAFGEGNWFLGYTMWAGIGIPDDKLSYWFFQFTFASTTSTILSGAVAERSTFLTYLVGCNILSGVIYPIVVHWCWTAEGWLYKLGFVDFSGGMIIHGLAGTVCLFATLIIGPRKGRFDNKYKNDITSHSTALIGIGAIIILVGFCGFNAGTINHYSHPGDGVVCARIMQNTLLTGAGGALFVLFAGKLGAFHGSRWPFTYTVNGGICGLVSSCASCNQLTSVECIILGLVAGLLYTGLHHVIILLKIDDPLDSSPVHLGGGFWSILALPLLKNGGVVSQPINNVLKDLLVQFIGGVGIMLWVAVTCIPIFGTLHLLNLLRSSEEEELAGMDVSKHSEPAYPDQIFMVPASPNAEMNYPIPGMKPRVSVLCTTAF